MGGYYYITAEGDTWDYIAYKVYGDEYQESVIMEAQENWQYLDTWMFEAGVKIWCPEINTQVESTDLPAWRM